MDRRESAEVTVRRFEFEMEWPPGHVAAYFVDCAEPVLVDAGMPNDEGTLREALDRWGYDPADIAHVVVTHPHVDHVGQVRTVSELGDPMIYAPAGVRERFRREVDTLAERVRANAREAGLTGSDLEEAVEMATESLERDRQLLPVDAVDAWVEDGERLSVGPLSLEAVHTPGHQADHLCYVTSLDGERALLAGDMVVEPFRAVMLHDGMDDGYREAFQAFYRALDRLASLQVDRVYPGHGPVHGAHSQTVDRDRGSLDHRLQTVADLVGEGHETVKAVTAAISNDGGRGARYVMLEVLAALAHLERNGRLNSEREDGVRHFAPA